MNLNLNIKIGRVGRTPEIKHLESGNTVATFSIATNRYFNTNNEKRTITDWHRVVCWGKNAELVEKYVQKGSEICVIGKDTTKSYEAKDGQKKYVHEIIADSIQLGSRPKSNHDENHQSTKDENDVLPQDEIEDDLPF